MDTKKLKCLLLGHKKSVPMITETTDHIYTSGCPRCNEASGLGFWKTMPPPPHSTPDQLKSWQKFLDKRMNALRCI